MLAGDVAHEKNEHKEGLTCNRPLNLIFFHYTLRSIPVLLNVYPISMHVQLRARKPARRFQAAELVDICRELDRQKPDILEGWPLAQP